MTNTTDLTAKAIQTRDHILNTALHLFAEQGYEKTTMRQIAGQAGYSLGLAYRYFASKEDFVLALFWQLHHEWAEEIAGLHGGRLATRFDAAMRFKLRQLSLYRDAMRALFTTMMNPASEVGVLSTSTVDLTKTVLHVMQDLVREAEDAPAEKHLEHITLLLYSAHLLIQLFWMYDRTPGQRATRELLDFSRDTLQHLPRMLSLPFLRAAIARLAAILAHVFGVQE